MQPFVPMPETADIPDTGVQDTEYLHGYVAYRIRIEYHPAEDKFRADQDTVAAAAGSAGAAERTDQSGYPLWTGYQFLRRIIDADDSGAPCAAYLAGAAIVHTEHQGGSPCSAACAEDT